METGKYTVEVLDVLMKAGISSQDTEMWVELLVRSGETAEMLFLEMFSDDPELLKNITENLRLKVEASQGKTSIDAIVDQESEMLLSLAQ